MSSATTGLRRNTAMPLVSLMPRYFGKALLYYTIAFRFCLDAFFCHCFWRRARPCRPANIIPGDVWSETRTRLECCSLEGLFRVALSGWTRNPNRSRLFNLQIGISRKSIRESWAGLLGPYSAVSWKVSKIEVAKSGELGYLAFNPGSERRTAAPC
jgi:hypothetical protein